MSIPGEDLANSLPAISFVGWYNGHPDYREPVGIVGRRGWVEGLRVERNQLGPRAGPRGRQGRPRGQVTAVPEMLEVIRCGG